MKQREGINMYTLTQQSRVISGTIAVNFFVTLFLIVYTKGRSNIFKILFFTVNGALDKVVYSKYFGRIYFASIQFFAVIAKAI